jgi:hypothetical protein
VGVVVPVSPEVGLLLVALLWIALGCVRARRRWRGE